ncbi:MAG: hypothetical protein JO070_02440 [Verrucomicrobia bacterium]|nr:hypothetical protein [Verrucomicrobiota bacterium]
MKSITQTAGVSGAKQPRRFVKIVAGTAALAGLLFGFDTGVISGAILFIKGAFGLSPFAEEVLVSVLSACRPKALQATPLQSMGEAEPFSGGCYDGRRRSADAELWRPC